MDAIIPIDRHGLAGKSYSDLFIEGVEPMSLESLQGLSGVCL
jgi:hypothetical protein